MVQFTYTKSYRDAENILTRLNDYRVWGVDTETNGSDPRLNNVLTLQIGRPGENYILDARYIDLDMFSPFLEDKDTLKICHLAEFEYLMLRKFARLNGLRCTFIAEKIIHNGRRGYFQGAKLDEVTAERLCIERSGNKKLLQKSFLTHTGEFSYDQLIYMAEDTEYQIPINKDQSNEMIRDGLADVYKIECGCIPVFSEMQYHGMPASKEKFIQLSEKHKREMDSLSLVTDESITQSTLFGASDVVNLKNSEQVLKTLRNMRIRVPVYNKETQVYEMKIVSKTDYDTLAPIASKYPIVDQILKYRKLEKRINEFDVKYVNNCIDNRLRSRILQLGALTGRPSVSSNETPFTVNLLNVPRDDEYRQCFQADDGFVYEVDDMNAIEPRILAALSGDKKMIEMFNAEGDFYENISKNLLNSSIPRNVVKVCLLEQIYLAGPQLVYDKLIASGINISSDDAYKAYNTLNNLFSCAMNYVREAGKEAAKNRLMYNANGRRRFWSPSEEDHVVKRSAANNTVQSVCADIMKLSMSRIHQYIIDNKIDSTIVNFVYDEIITHTRESQSESFVRAKRDIMVSTAQEFLKVIPAKVSGKIAKYWVKD